MNRLLYTLVIMAGLMFQACSSDDEPAVLAGVEVSGTSFQMTEAGEASLGFTVTPADASVDNIALVKGGEAFEIIDKAPAGDGKWTVRLKATDFANVGADNNVTLSIAQTGGVTKDADFNIEDPFSIDGKFDIFCPRAFNFYGAEDSHKDATCLPILINATNESDLAMINVKDIKLTTGAISQKVSPDGFVLEPMADNANGVVMKANQSKLDELKSAITTYTTLEYRLILTSKIGRMAALPLSVMTCRPEGTVVENEELTIAKADIENPDYHKEITLDVTHNLRQIGVMELGNNVTIEEIGLLNDKGEAVAEGSIIPAYITDSEGNMVCDFNIYGDTEFDLAPGTYTYVQRFHVTVTVKGVNYTTACADLRFKVVIK